MAGEDDKSRIKSACCQGRQALIKVKRLPATILAHRFFFSFGFSSSIRGFSDAAVLQVTDLADLADLVDLVDLELGCRLKSPDFVDFALPALLSVF